MRLQLALGTSNPYLPGHSGSQSRVACGVWRVACGVWRVACGVWRVACGVWRVACGRALIAAHNRLFDDFAPRRRSISCPGRRMGSERPDRMFVRH